MPSKVMAQPKPACGQGMVMLPSILEACTRALRSEVPSHSQHQLPPYHGGFGLNGGLMVVHLGMYLPAVDVIKHTSQCVAIKIFQR